MGCVREAKYLDQVMMLEKRLREAQELSTNREVTNQARWRETESE
jgi:hypothetical protein